MRIRLPGSSKVSERGQAIVLIAMAILALVAFAGLMTDAGVLFIEYARLKRGIDAAALSAALTFRENVTEAELVAAAEQFLRFNQSDVSNIEITICERDEDGDPVTTQPPEILNDPALCTDIPRKLVRVTATRTVRFGFLRVIGWEQSEITASAVGEAAALDMVLVIDTSQSMSNETTGGPNASDPGDDPALCNLNNSCQPLATVKQVAIDFVNNALYFPYDRVAIIASTSQNPGEGREPTEVIPLTANGQTVLDALAGLTVFEPRACDEATSEPGTCRALSPSYSGMGCDYCADFDDWSSYTSSNLGGAMLLAGDAFSVQPIREESLWVVIMLAGGPANASDAQGDPNDVNNPLRFGFCPDTEQGIDDTPFCRDDEWPLRPAGAPGVDTRHCYSGPGWDYRDSCIAAGGALDVAMYDADDYARDMADFVAGAPSDTAPTDTDGQGAVIFTIGLGSFVSNTSVGDPVDGQELLMYMAEEAGDAMSPGVVLNHGFYSASATDPAELERIFNRIADSVATRLSQ